MSQNNQSQNNQSQSNQNPALLQRLRASTAAFASGELDLDAVQAVLQSTMTLLENDGADTARAVGLAEADVEEIRSTRPLAEQRRGILDRLEQLLADLPDEPVDPWGGVVDGHDTLAAYRRLADQLLTGAVTPLEFETQFLDQWRTQRPWPTGAAYRALERLFFVVEDYVDDPALRDPGSRDLDEVGLRDGVRRFVEETRAG